MQKDDTIIDNIRKLHNNDESQIKIVESQSDKTMVEASAGCGKTKVLISTIAYNIAKERIQSTKKILALTFSVNAAYKIKKDVIEQLPLILGEDNIENKTISKNILVSNYHGLCRRILSLYGKRAFNMYLDLKDYNVVSDDKIPNSILLSDQEKYIIKNVNDSIINADIDQFTSLLSQYNDIIINKILVEKYITYNSIISLVLEIFFKFPNLKQQYRNLFEFIIVDEYQDTNILGYLLLKEIIHPKTRLLFFGDSLQRIYGFIGAIPNIMQKTIEEFQMKKIELSINYRFKDNIELLQLDKNIRFNAHNPDLIEKNSNPNIVCAHDYESEYSWIIDKINNNISNDISTTILVKSLSSNYNTSYLLSKLKSSDIKFFYALFTDDSDEYVKFHTYAYETFINMIKDKRVVTKKIIEKFYLKIINKYDNNLNEIYNSLIILLRKFLDSIYEIYQIYKMDDLINYIIDIFANNGLKQYMNRIDEKVIVATIHSYKGLEAECVIVTDLESNNFPNYYTCKYCTNSNTCLLFGGNKKNYLEELSVFYVAITRARKELYLTYSKNQLTKFGVKDCNKSCMLNLKGIGYLNQIDI